MVILATVVVGLVLFLQDGQTGKKIGFDEKQPDQEKKKQSYGPTRPSKMQQNIETQTTKLETLPIIQHIDRTYIEPIPPLMPLFPIYPRITTADEYYQKTADYDKAVRDYDMRYVEYQMKLRDYGIVKAQYDKFKKDFPVSHITTVSYAQGLLSTDQTELQVHNLINDERKKHGLDSLTYDYKISDIAHSHSSDMSVNDFLSHDGSDGKSLLERSKQYGYSQCGDIATIELREKYDELSKQFEETGKSDAELFSQLETMREQLNSAIEQKMLFRGLSENILQNNLYTKYRTMNGVITSYDWKTPDEIAKSIVVYLMSDPSNRQSILNPHYTKEGIGVEISPDYKVYLTQNFC